MLTKKDHASYLMYKVTDALGILIGLGVCAKGNDMAQNPVNSAGEYVKSTAMTGNILIGIGIILVVLFGVMLYNLSTAKDEIEDDLREEARIRKVMTDNDLTGCNEDNENEESDESNNIDSDE
jgi:hypothetical protein